MPTETRRIDFTDIELKKALSLYEARTQGGRPMEGRVSNIKVMGGENFNVVARVSPPDGGVVKHKVFDHNTMIAVLVLFARHVKMPLPRNAKKQLTPTGYGGVSMTLRHHIKITP